MILYSFPSNSKPSMSYQPMLLWIVHLIESSSLQTVPNFLTALLESHNPELETAVSAIKSPNGIRKILTLMAAYQSDGTAEMWALEMSQRIYVNEVKTVIHKVHGLHFNAHGATVSEYNPAYQTLRFSDTSLMHL